MDDSGESIGSSLITPQSDVIKHNQGKLVSDKQREIIQVVVFVFLCGLVSLFGIITNIFNLVVFCKQGLNSSINISFFALAVSDMCSLITQQWVNVCLNPLFDRSDVLIVPAEVQYITGSVPREVFGKITCLITVYVTAERCLCIAFPLRVKQMITPKRTAAVLTIIYCVCFLSVAPLYFAISIGWKFYPERNKTLLGQLFGSNNEKMEEPVYVMQALSGILSFAAVVIFTSVLILKLNEKRTWREKTANMDKDKSDSLSNRDRKTMSMIVLIASILIVCYIPSVVIFVATFFEPEFSIVGCYTNMFIVTWSFGFLFESINSSVNIFLYYKMSSKYRNTFHDLICKCK